jgi:hypothetical protein
MAGNNYTLKLLAQIDEAGSAIQNQLNLMAGKYSIAVNAIIQKALQDANNAVTPPSGGTPPILDPSKINQVSSVMADYSKQVVVSNTETGKLMQVTTQYGNAIDGLTQQIVKYNKAGEAKPTTTTTTDNPAARAKALQSELVAK